MLCFLNRAKLNAAITGNSVSIQARFCAFVQHSISCDSDNPVYCHKSPDGLDVSTHSCTCQKIGSCLVQVMVFTYSVPSHYQTQHLIVLNPFTHIWNLSTFQGNVVPKSNFFNDEDAFQIVVNSISNYLQMSFTAYRPQCVTMSWLIYVIYLQLFVCFLRLLCCRWGNDCPAPLRMRLG